MRNATVKALLLLCLGAVGCANQVEQTAPADAQSSPIKAVEQAPRHVVNAEVYIPAEAPADTQEQVLAAVSEWESAAPGSVALKTVLAPASDIAAIHDNAHIIRFVFKSSFEDDAGGLCPQQNSAAGVVLADASEQNGVATLCMMNYTDTDYTVRTLAEHEMGHVFGLHHEDGEIMQAVHSDTIQHLTAGDVAQFCSHWDCQ